MSEKSFAIEPHPIVSLPVGNGDTHFPVRKIYCVGQNYAEHAKEMGQDPDRNPPFFFSKPHVSLVANGGNVPYPPKSENVHHEVELVVAIGKKGRDLSLDQAAGLVFGYGVGIDLTRRDLQAEAKEKSRPWDVSKGFDHSAPVSSLVLKENWQPGEGIVQLGVNEELRQNGHLSDMIWGVDELISILSEYFTLMPGDLIFTGTPAGVGPLQKGDRVAAYISGLPELSLTIT